MLQNWHLKASNLLTWGICDTGAQSGQVNRRGELRLKQHVEGKNERDSEQRSQSSVRRHRLWVPRGADVENRCKSYPAIR